MRRSRHVLVPCGTSPEVVELTDPAERTGAPRAAPDSFPAAARWARSAPAEGSLPA